MTEFQIRPLDPEKDAPGIVAIVDEIAPYSTLNVPRWLHQWSTTPSRARPAGWVATVDGEVGGFAQASGTWFSSARSVYAGVNVARRFRRIGIGGELWERVELYIEDFQPSRVGSTFRDTEEAVRFARARGFREVRAETLSRVDPGVVDFSPLEAVEEPIRLVPLSEISPEEVYAVDVATTVDVPMTEPADDIRYEEWLDTMWGRPALTLDGSFAVVDDSSVVSIAMLAANVERQRALNEYTGTLRSHRGRGLATLAKLASLRWAKLNGITAVWTMNDETNAAMLSVNYRLGYRPGIRRVEYERKAPRRRR